MRRQGFPVMLLATLLAALVRGQEIESGSGGTEVASFSSGEETSGGCSICDAPPPSVAPPWPAAPSPLPPRVWTPPFPSSDEGQWLVRVDLLVSGGVDSALVEDVRATFLELFPQAIEILVLVDSLVSVHVVFDTHTTAQAARGTARALTATELSSLVGRTIASVDGVTIARRGAPPPPSAPPARRSESGVLMAISVSVVAILLAVGGVVVAHHRLRSRPRSGDPPPGRAAPPPPRPGLRVRSSRV